MRLATAILYRALPSKLYMCRYKIAGQLFRCGGVVRCSVNEVSGAQWMAGCQVDVGVSGGCWGVRWILGRQVDVCVSKPPARLHGGVLSDQRSRVCWLCTVRTLEGAAPDQAGGRLGVLGRGRSRPTWLGIAQPCRHNKVLQLGQKR